MSILDDLGSWRHLVDGGLRGYLDTFGDVDGTRAPARLREAMAHALLAGGKRLRPLVCMAVTEAVYSADDADSDDALSLALPACVGLELVHTYSLVHDDLPALDNDDLRRGRPTVHRAYDEGTAVLVGDALLTDAFAVVARSTYLPAQQVLELALAAGSAGMVAGQHDDVQSEGRALSEQTFAALKEIHRQKTGRLFAAAAALGALAANRPDLVDKARAWGAALGFAFQVQDDVIDV
ncbi:MAG TPA: polyprenyl synthetase family protein, partial [Myxococcota bacterium]